MGRSLLKKGGMRTQKRRETLERIAETGLNLFVKNGYEATTLDDVAKAAGISRRTFFYYFKSKEEILLAWQSGFYDAIRKALLEESNDQEPLDAARNALLKLVTRYQSDDAIAIDRLMRSNQALQARKQANYVLQEQAAYAGLSELWPQPKRQRALRLVAMISIGAMRLAIETWNQEGFKRPIAAYLREAFASLKAEV
jgi:AcrR family transcriptional regulator